MHLCDVWQVECLLFPLMRDQRLMLSSVSADESLVKDYIQRAMDIFQSNTLGPQKYLNLYRKYTDLLNGKSDQDVTNFLGKHHSVDSFVNVSRHCSCSVACSVVKSCGAFYNDSSVCLSIHANYRLQFLSLG